ncbi:hypothetical protein C7S18_10600 [Ahniella affigens]|uniref:Protein kinase domain-containing protein n=1 Tax=Ahniella affigens TaxID=2021234 RepID=A0A2P1PS13_9GAMM|nr:serine/threonine-protein kinase [Ahniella affigens]AVP97620.1 hypothetical protein C7S18_10600 [Ahniella affigens]
MNPVTPEQFAALDQCLQQALDLPPSEREAYLQAHCGGDADQLMALRALLAHCDDSQTEWERLPMSYLNAHVTEILDTKHLPRIANWRLLRELGAGGMARVFLAERDVQGATQRAAIKLLQGGQPDAELMARFERERRILASLDDPRIARFYDAGIASDGRPWLAMEYVDGARIDTWCDQHQLNIRARVQLMQQVALALASAHNRLVLHRDIKPANVLVDATGLPKILDFGIAKVLADDDATDGLTRTQQRLLTLHYASPEQLLGEPVGVASDIYQLGLMMYELLSGQRPFARDEVSLPRLIRAIDDRQVPPLRQAFDDADPESGRRAQARANSPARLRRLLSGDLQQITNKALARDPLHRYGSAIQFADDLEHYLSGRPVLAVAPSLAYRLKRLLARHPLAAALAASLLIAIAAGISATLWQTREALRQRDQAQAEAEKSARLVEFLTNALATANPTRSQGETVTAKALLDGARARIDEELQSRDATRSDLLAAMSQAYGGLALREPQLKLAEESLSIERELDRPSVLTRRMVLAATALRETSQPESAYALFQEAESRLRADPAESQGYLGQVLYLKAMTEFSLRQFERSEHSLEQAIALLSQASDARERDRNAARLMLSRLWATNGRLDDAIRMIETTVAALRTAKPPRRAELEEALDALGSVYRKAERWPEQTAAYREARDLAIEVYGPEHLDVAILSHNLAGALLSEGNVAEALTLTNEAVSLGARSVGPLHAFSVSAKLRQIEARCRSGDEHVEAAEWSQLQAGIEKHPNLADLLTQRQQQCGIRK